MRRFFLLSALTLFTVTSFAQDTSFLRTFNVKRVRNTKNAMLVLGGWGAANIAIGLIGAGTTDGQSKYFYQMNAIWGAVNLGIATASYFGKRNLNEDLAGTVKEQRKIEKIYLINGGLDLVYIAGGLLLRKHGHDLQPGKDQDKWKGYGTSVIAQGAFLLLYDGINFTMHHRHGKLLPKDAQLTVAPGGVSMTYKF